MKNGGAGAFACQLLIRARGWQAEAPAPRPLRRSLVFRLCSAERQWREIARALAPLYPSVIVSLVTEAGGNGWTMAEPFRVTVTALGSTARGSSNPLCARGSLAASVTPATDRGVPPWTWISASRG